MLEEQAHLGRIDVELENKPVEATLRGPALYLVAAVEKPSGEMAFEFGLSLLIAGLEGKVEDRLETRKPLQHG